MNTATRAAVRLALDEGHQMLGVHGGFQGLIDGDVEDLAVPDANTGTIPLDPSTGYSAARLHVHSMTHDPLF